MIYREDLLEEEWKNMLRKEIAGAVLGPKILMLTKEMAEECFGENMPESAGYIQGSVQGDQFFIFSNQNAGGGLGNTTSIGEFTFPYRILEEELRRDIPGYRKVVYHTHPKISESILRKYNPQDSEGIIDFAKEQINQGIFDYLLDEGRKIDVDEVLTELLSRELNEEDRKNTPGKYHLLLTNTTSRLNPFSHLNFYDLFKQRIVPIRFPKNRLEKSILGDLEKKHLDVLKQSRQRELKEIYGVNSREEQLEKYKDYSVAIIPGYVEHLVRFHGKLIDD